MAKGDKNKFQAQMDKQATASQAGLTGMAKQSEGTYNSMMNNYDQGSQLAFGSYDDLMGGYKDYIKNNRAGGFGEEGGQFGGGGGNVTPERVAVNEEFVKPVREAIAGYRGFADNGGYSGQDVQELRARGVAPVRSAYGNSMMEMDRARALGGSGGASNYIAAASKAQRQLPGQMADALTGVNADLADKVVQGKKFGLSGLQSAGLGQQGMYLNADQGNQSAFLQAGIANQNNDYRNAMARMSQTNPRGGNELAALGGMASLYGATPGMANLFGNQALAAQGQQYGGLGMQMNHGQNQVANQYQASQIPSNFQSTLGNIGQIASIAGQVGLAGMTGGMGNLALGAMGKGALGGIGKNLLGGVAGKALQTGLGQGGPQQINPFQMQQQRSFY